MTVAAMIDRLRRIPEDARSYECDERFARLHFGLGDGDLRALLDAGLPARENAEGMRFDACDLHYIGLRLRSASTYLWAIEGWATGLTRFAARPETHVLVEYVPQLGAKAAAVEADVLLPSGARRTLLLENGRSVVQERVVLRGEWPPVPPAAAAIAREVAESLSFCLLPRAVQGDVELVRRIGLSDCLTAAYVIADECERAGLEARASSGLMVSLPYSSWHGWPEVRCGDEWIPLDPLLTRVMCTYGGLDAASWPPERSTGPMLVRLGEADEPIIVTDGAAADLSLITTVLA